MKTISPALVLFLAATSSFGQWTTDVTVNTTVRALTPGEAAVPLTAEGPAGSTYTSWFENGSGEYQLRMQRLDAGGNRLWADTGLVVSAHPQNSALFRYDMQEDDDGKAIVAFQDERTGTLDIVAYKIAPDGTFIWGPDGVELPTVGGTGLSPRVAALENGNTVVAWTTDHDTSRVAFQILAPDGTLLLPVASSIADDAPLDRPVPIATDDGGFFIQFVKQGDSFLSPATMWTQRFDATGATVWPGPIIVSWMTISGFYFPQPVSDGENGFYVAFNTMSLDNPNFTDVYVQRIYANGDIWSVQGTRLDNSATTQKFTVGKGLVLMEDEEQDGLMVALQVTDGSQAQSGIAVQRLDTAGVPQLGDAAVTVIPMGTEYVQPMDIAATNDGAVIVHQSGGFGQVHIAATRVDLSGATVWTPAQMDLCTANSNKDDLQLTEEEDGQVVSVWKDERSPNGIYAQNMTGLDLETGVWTRVNNMDLRLEQNPADQPVLLTDGNFGENLQVKVFDARGTLVFRAVLPAREQITLPLGQQAPGLYTIQVVGNGKAGMVRWVKS